MWLGSSMIYSDRWSDLLRIANVASVLHRAKGVACGRAVTVADLAGLLRPYLWVVSGLIMGHQNRSPPSMHNVNALFQVCCWLVDALGLSLMGCLWLDLGFLMVLTSFQAR
jgi:hypothetical protein